MKRTIFVATLLAIGAGAVFAQSDSIAQRQALMKANGKAAKAVAVMLQENATFDLAKAQASLKTFINGAEKGPELFPDDSKTGGESHALPTIWENKTDFNAHFTKLGHDATALLGMIKDKPSFRALMPSVLKDCGGCHETYRAKLE